MKLIFLVEELSAKFLLDGLLPRILPEGIEYQIIPHSGKKDLEKSIPRKLRGWNEPGDIRFVILHDRDNADCIALKQSLREMCSITKKPVLIRIACQELEAWYFGDTNALSRAYNDPRLQMIAKKRAYRTPDEILNPKEAIYRLIPQHQQISGAKLIAQFMDVDNNTSTSFQAFVSGIRRLILT